MREALLEKWKQEDVGLGEMGFFKETAHSVSRWAQGERSRVINLGLDLQGGTHLLYEVDVSELPEDLKESKKWEWTVQTAVPAAVGIIRNRIDQFGTTEPVIQRQGRNRILVQLPGEKDPERAKELIGNRAQLKFHLVEGPTATERVIDAIDKKFGGNFKQRLIIGKSEVARVVFPIAETANVKTIVADAEKKGLVPEGMTFAFGKMPKPTEEQVRGLWLMEKEPSMSGDTLISARPASSYQSMGGFQILLRFNTEGGVKFAKLTGDHVKELLGAVLDGVVQEVATITEKIPNGRAQITGRFTAAEATDLAIALGSGALPAPLHEIEERAVSPTLGQESIDRGLRAAFLGLVLVVVFMIVYYRFAGIVANIALALNVLIILGALGYFHATLTLPGIAGIILTIGMAVDANVLIFERVREESLKGKTIRAAIDTGYAKALLTILDANVTTLIAALVLFQFGTGPVKGFAITLSIGVVSSVFTAIVVTRVIFDTLTQKRILQKLGMMRFVGKTSIPFVAVRRVAFVFSVVAIVVGLGFFAVRGGGNFGIDFSPGTMVHLRFEQPSSTGDIRSALERGGVTDAIIQEAREYGGEANREFLIRTAKRDFGFDDQGAAAVAPSTAVINIIKESGIGAFETTMAQDVGPAVGKELTKDAFLAMLIAMAGIIIYISVRFEYRFAIAAVLALAHDVLITVGLFAVTGREISLPVVAALLTIVGYSLNDTIVVFDRIRENLKLMRGTSYPEIINASINQVLSRTILTSMTTLVVVLCLYFLGGLVINSFAFALLVGVAVGTYSSIFVASPVLIAWQGLRKHR